MKSKLNACFENQIRLIDINLHSMYQPYGLCAKKETSSIYSLNFIQDNPKEIA